MTKSLSPRMTLALLTGLNLFNYLDRYILSAVLEPLKAELSLSDGELGRIFTAFMLGYFVTSPFFGYLGDRSSRKWIIATAIFVWSLGTVLTGLATGFVALLAFRVLVGVGEAGYGSTGPSWISDVFPRERRNNALTIFYVAVPVGAALGYVVGGWVSAHWGWREAFIFAGVPGLLLAALLLPFREPKRGESDGLQNEHKVPSLGEIAALCRNPRYVLVVLGYSAYTFAMGAYSYWGPTFLTRVHGMSPQASATFFGGTLVVSGLVATLLGGFVATAWQKRNRAGYALVLGLSVLVALPLAWIWVHVSSVTAAMACVAAAIFFLFLCTGPVNTLIIEVVPVNVRSSAMALSIFTIHLLGDMWSPEIVGHLSDKWQNLGQALLIPVIGLAVTVVLWLALAFSWHRLEARQNRSLQTKAG